MTKNASTDGTPMHTAGPWKVVRDPNEMPGIFTEKNEPICDVYEHGAPEGMHNASLISAAPELLEIAKDYLNMLWDEFHPHMSLAEFDADPDVVKTRAALAKAGLVA